jgi:putative NADH-flavin reductase
MKLVVLGATGGTGREIVRQAIERGHSVTAFVRNPDGLQRNGNHVAVVQGDLLNPDNLARVIAGHDAVISGFGPRVPVSKADAHLLQQFALVLTDAMHMEQVRRAVVVSVAFLFKNSLFPPAYLLGRLLFPQVVADASAMESVIKSSGLDWTLVRPPELTDKPYTGKYRVRMEHLPNFGFSISRADVADYMLKIVDDHATVGKIIGVSN